MTAPSSEAVVAVDSWIKSNNLTGSVVSDAHLLREGFVRLSVTVEQAENLLNCKYMTYVDSDGHEVQRVDESGYSVSDAIDRFVSVIEPTVRFPAPRRGPLLKSSPVVNGGITPAGVRTAYGITGAGAHGKSTKNRVAIASFLGQFWTQADLEKFWTELSPDSAGNNPTVLGPNSGQVRAMQCNAMLCCLYEPRPSQHPFASLPSHHLHLHLAGRHRGISRHPVRHWHRQRRAD